MKADKYLDKIKEAISYASQEGNVTAYNWNEALKDKTVVAFGTGKFFEDTHERLFRMVHVQYVCDNNEEKWGHSFYGKKCLAPSELKELEDVFVIIVMGDCRSVMKQLRNEGIPSMHISEMHFSNYEKGKICEWLWNALPDIEKALTILGDDHSREIFTNVFCNKIYLSYSRTPYASFAEEGEYFENGCWELGKEEFFVDGGAYIGDTVTDFLKHVGGNFGAVYSFEYEKGNYDILCENVQKLPDNIVGKIETYCCGIWDEKQGGWCEYLGESDGTQIVSEQEKGDKAQWCMLDKLDDVLENKKVTILKLDIEGAEMHGLRGARRIISKQSPKLAICLYHCPEDLWQIPLFIKELNPDYKLMIKHHNILNYADTVLYATVRERDHAGLFL